MCYMLGLLYSSIDPEGKNLDRMGREGPLHHEHMHLTEPQLITPVKASSCFISPFHFQECSFCNIHESCRFRH